ncbi:MAG: hypothetical protein AAFY72_09060 [Cyanobacteria bacterium J06649_4]
MRRVVFSLMGLFLISAPALAVPHNYQSHANCRNASNQVIASLEDERDLRVDTLTSSPSYRNYSAERTHRYGFNMRGSGNMSVIQSPVFMASVASAFLDDCSHAGTVTFGVAGTGIFATFGEVDGNVQRFQCAEDIGRYPRRDDNRPLPWGYQFCSL